MNDLHKTLTLTRKEKTIIVVVRQMAHDVQAVVGKKFKYDTGPMWTVLEVRG